MERASQHEAGRGGCVGRIQIKEEERKKAGQELCESKPHHSGPKQFDEKTNE